MKNYGRIKKMERKINLTLLPIGERSLLTKP